MEHATPDLYGELAGLALEVEGYSTERRELEVSSGFTRVTTTVVLRGGGEEGRGEDVTYQAEDHEQYPLELPLQGSWTLDALSQRLGGLDLFPSGGPAMAFQKPYRRWAFESAALDLALRRAGRSLGAALGLDYRPVRFVVSTRLDITPWLEVAPQLEFKLDPTPEWDGATVTRIAATGRVRALDFKSFYEGTVVDNPPDPVLYRAVADAFPDTILEDPATEGPAREVLRGDEGRFSFDAPIHSWRDVEEVGGRAGLAGTGSDGRALPRHLNVKPSRFGSIRALLDCVGRAQAAGIELYGGGQFELGVGRQQIEALASLLYPDGPNDVAPTEYHGTAHAGVPASPLVPLHQPSGFSFVFRR